MYIYAYTFSLSIYSAISILQSLISLSSLSIYFAVSNLQTVICLSPLPNLFIFFHFSEYLPDISSSFIYWSIIVAPNTSKRNYGSRSIYLPIFCSRTVLLSLHLSVHQSLSNHVLHCRFLSPIFLISLSIFYLSIINHPTSLNPRAVQSLTVNFLGKTPSVSLNRVKQPLREYCRR